VGFTFGPSCPARQRAYAKTDREFASRQGGLRARRAVHTHRIATAVMRAKAQ
jgi:hypothetical protein